jgi:hypothetical protein
MLEETSSSHYINHSDFSALFIYVPTKVRGGQLQRQHKYMETTTTNQDKVKRGQQIKYRAKNYN